MNTIPLPKGENIYETQCPILYAMYPTIPPSVEYSLTERGKTLIPALESIYNWADSQMKSK